MIGCDLEFLYRFYLKTQSCNGTDSRMGLMKIVPPRYMSSIKGMIPRNYLPSYSAKMSSHIFRDRCYDFLNIFDKKIGEKIVVFDSKQS
jgi:hypothetical protein